MTTDNAGKTAWFDLPVSNLWDAMSFYEGLLSWKYVQMEDSPETDYVMIQVGGSLIGGLRRTEKRVTPQPELSLPLIYFTVGELAPKVKRAKELGAILVGEKVDLGKQRGCYQRILDREKNLIALWAPR
jgi:predicted enzyme related to lactoylglutathione lyase